MPQFLHSLGIEEREDRLRILFYRDTLLEVEAAHDEKEAARQGN